LLFIKTKVHNVSIRRKFLEVIYVKNRVMKVQLVNVAEKTSRVSLF
jgi:hypothetical protein